MTAISDDSPKRRRSQRTSGLFLGTAFLGTVLVALVSGCRPAPPFGEVEGVITKNGQPLPEVLVQFYADHEAGTRGPLSTGITDEKGHYQLRTYKGQVGAIVGQHRVCVVDLPSPIPPPPKYSSPTETPLTAVEVKPGKQTINFDLK